MKKYIYDIETFKYAFVVVFKCIDNEKIYTFEISSRKNEQKELIKFLKTCNGLIGFNNNSFDYPILDNIIKKRINSCEEIYDNATEVINSDYTAIPSWKQQIPQLDLYLIHHYNNVARSASLKYLEFSLRYHKVQDLPYEPHEELTSEMIDELIDYCINDVEFTYTLFKESRKQIKFRQKMSKKLKHNVMNYSDVKIGEYINRITYEKLSGRKYKEFKNKRTYHSVFKMKDIIPKEVSFKTEIFNSFFEDIKNIVFKNDEKIVKYINLPGIKLKFAKGGLHSEDKPRIVKNKLGYLSELDIGLANWPL